MSSDDEMSEGFYKNANNDEKENEADSVKTVTNYRDYSFPVNEVGVDACGNINCDEDQLDCNQNDFDIEEIEEKNAIFLESKDFFFQLCIGKENGFQENGKFFSKCLPYIFIRPNLAHQNNV